MQITSTCGTITDSIIVDYTTPPIVNLGNDTTLCTGQTLLLNAAFPGATYLWSDNTIDSTLNVTSQGNYSVDVTNKCGTSSDNIQVSYSTAPNFNLGNDTTLCPGQILSLDATDPNTTAYLWSDGTTNPTFTITQQGKYGIELSNGTCSSSDSININYTSIPSVNLGNDTTLCEGQNIVLNAFFPNATCEWIDGSKNATLKVSQQGFYWVTLTNQCGTKADSININYKSLPKAHLGNDTTLCFGQHVLLNALLPNVTYKWQDGSTGSTFNVTQLGNYFVEVSNSCGTSRESINFIDGNCGSCSIFIPNSFTPNGDDNNDSFFPEFDCEMNTYELVIFNRWGELIFEAQNTDSKWDGNYNGKLAPLGVYAYRLKYITNEFERNKLTGHVNLLK